MGGDHAFYQRSGYGLESPDYGSFLGFSYRTPVSGISVATDARTANQLKTTTEKLSSGAKAIEVQMTMPEVAESIPNQHLDELRRLRQITGAEFTLHGPLVEPTGVTRQGWEETHRVQAERQMWSAVERGNRLNPDGNIVITFHSSNGLPSPETKSINAQGKEVIETIATVDEHTGQFNQIALKSNPLLGKENPNPIDQLKKQNKEAWLNQLSQASFHAHTGENSIRQILEGGGIPQELREDLKSVDLQEFYKKSKTSEGQKFMADLKPEAKKFLRERIDSLNYGEIYVRQAYQDLQNLFNTAWDNAKKDKRQDDIDKLKTYRDELKPYINEFENPQNIAQMADMVQKGIDVLNTVQTPRLVRPLKEFAIDKASDTFSNLAFKAYNKWGADKAPIISIENPPAGSGLSRADELRDLIEASQKKFVDKAKETGMSEDAAQKAAKKLIGATWDVGHINMLKKYGYDNTYLTEKQTKVIAPYVKNIHLSDNFGMEHTELPMGMGNVPTKAHMDILDGYNKQLKKVIETGNWYQHFQTTPLVETLEAFGSNVYSTGGQAWNQVSGRLTGGYFGGYGLNPEVHHSIYGAGFSGLPTELGGTIPGTRSRFSGTPFE